MEIGLRVIYSKYRMKSDIFRFEELKVDPLFEVKKFSDSVYLGQMMKDKRYGKGIMIYNNG